MKKEKLCGLFQKKCKQGRGVEGWGHGFSRGIAERACGNSRGTLKKKWDFQGCSRKSHLEFPWVLVFDLGISKGCHTILQNFRGQKLVFSGISKGKVTNLKILEGFSEKYVLNPCLCLDFFWNSPMTENSPYHKPVSTVTYKRGRSSLLGKNQSSCFGQSSPFGTHKI